MNRIADNIISKYSKRRFIIFFVVFVGLATLFSHIVMDNPIENQEKASANNAVAQLASAPVIEEECYEETQADTFDLIQQNEIKGVLSFTEDFPDANDVQLIAAEKNGISPLHSRDEAQPYINNHQLVYIGDGPFYVIDDLDHSIPYLTPKASHLLSTISVNFIDSLISKGVQPHKLVVTSVLRTAEDIENLQRGNRNSVTNSAHCYGTTMDITYTRFLPIPVCSEDNVSYTRHDFQLQRILSEVLADLRTRNKCYVKYERRQACFHLTVR